MKDLPSTVLVIFGITGDLSHRKLLPALAEIKKTGQLPESFKILGVSRRSIAESDILAGEYSELGSLLDVYTMDVNQPAEYTRLKQKLDSYANGQIIFYFAVPPTAVLPMVRNLGAAGLNSSQTKLLLEKPFGIDYSSAKELINEINTHFKEEQVFRIDHYLAKEMAQNITVFLGSNTIFRDLWTNEFIESIDISALETIGIEGRVELYESTGILRDWVQSHLLQLASLVLMEPCSDIFDFEEIPKRRLAALEALQPVTDLAQVMRAQYQGYRDEVGNPESAVETFVNLTVESSDSRWQGVPVHLTAGKKLDQKLTEISVHFKKTDASAANRLIFRIVPNEAIEIDLWVKKPGYERELEKLKLDFTYGQARLPDAYEMVLVDAMRSNHSLFAGSAEVLASWKVLQPVLDIWQKGSQDLKFYKPGSTIGEIISKKQ